ncbi:MAG: UDP-3-O-[3-hydroxymyristoyl] N-acetylglucosamine deacetylase [Rhodospirillales bacterium 12-54-5]|nr:MAG: UDP-3-O-[3-hydroxymyristoyl] N-acetylglucosamine deacetylase [Rhodospirillales bacterium 12-54-5]
MNPERDALFQHTVAAEVSCVGVSLHTGDMVNMTIRPAAPNTGIVFVRTDVAQHQAVPARYDAVVETTLGTTIANSHGVTVSTIEHVMAALWGAGIDNARIELDAAEVPIMDGSSEPFVFLLDCAGRVQQRSLRRTIEVLREVTVEEGKSIATIAPHDGFALDIEIAFNHKLIATQKAQYDFTRTSFKQSLARARTFGFARDVEKMRSMGLALGGSLHNAIVLDEEQILNEGGLRYADEFVRHKALDCIGDYFLAQGAILGTVKTTRPGHGVNNKLLRALFADPANYRITGGEEIDVPFRVTRPELQHAMTA